MTERYILWILLLIRHNHSAEYLNFQKLSVEWEFEKKKQAKPKNLIIPIASLVKI